MSDRDWTHAFDGLRLKDPAGSDEGIDLGEFLRLSFLDEGTIAMFETISERITELSKAAIEASSGWIAAPDAPIDTGVATPDVQFVAVPIPVEGRIQIVYGPFEDGGQAVEVAQGLSSDPDECYVVPVVAWES